MTVDRVGQVAGFLARIFTEAGRTRVRVEGGAGSGFAAALDGQDGISVSDPADVVVFLRSASGTGDRERDADVVIDHHDPAWPVIRRVRAELADPELWYVPETRAFFGIRAAGWDARFGDDLPAYARAVAICGIRPGDTVLDVGCGTGRALPALAAAVGATGRVIGLDLTPDMLAAAHRARDVMAALAVADARRLPLADACADAVFAAGLVQHLPDPAAGLTELARVTRPGGRLMIFHPSGRAALAARHGRTLGPDEPLAEARLAPSLAAAGWTLTRYDDPPDHFLATATRSVTP